MCMLAQSVGEHIVWPQDNCNLPYVDYNDGIVYGVAKPARVTCEERAAYFAEHHYTYGQIERPLEERDICPGRFLYGVMLRDPVKLALSRLRQQSAGSPRNFGVWTSHLECVEKKSVELCDALGAPKSPPGQLPDIEVLHQYYPIWRYFDNFQTRMLGGQAVWDLPPGAVNATHAAAVIDRLERFDVVTHLEGLKDGAPQRALRNTFGWRIDRDDMFPVNQALVETASYEFPAAYVERARAVLKPDYMIYEHFRSRGAR